MLLGTRTGCLRLTAAVLAAMTLGACAGGRTKAPAPPAADAGVVYGTVRLRQGNCMPALEGPSGSEAPRSCTVTPFVTTVAAYPPVEAVPAPADPGRPVAATRSGADGAYELRIPPGRYSILAEEGGRPWCDRFEESGGSPVACPVEVGRRERVERNLTVNRAAD